MKKKPKDYGTVVCTRFLAPEIAAIDTARLAQTIPVTRAALLGHIVREWLKQSAKASK